MVPEMPRHIQLYFQALATMRASHFRLFDSCSLWAVVAPSFGNIVQYEIVPDEKIGFFAIRREWRRDLDEPRLSAGDGPLVPKIVSGRSDIDAVVASKWIELFSRSALPLNVSGDWGLDGTNYELGLRAKQGRAAMEIRWWCDGPKEWAPWVAGTVTFIKAMERLRFNPEKEETI